MSFMNKVKNAISNHQSSGKRSSVENQTNVSGRGPSKGSDNYGTSSYGQDPSHFENSGNAYGSSNGDTGLHQDSNMNKGPSDAGNAYRPSDARNSMGPGSYNSNLNNHNPDSDLMKGRSGYGSTNSSGGNYSSNKENLGSWSERNMGSNDRRASNVKEVSGFDSSSIDSCGRNPNAGGENLDSTSSTLNQGSGGIDTSNKMDSRRTSDLGAYYGTNTVGTHAMRQQSDKSGPNYGSNVDRNFSSGKRNSNVAMIQDPVESEMNNPIGNQGFGGGAAADGSSNQGKSSSGRRRSSGPHNSNLLNKLDPRVRSSDYKENTAVDQRRKY